MFAFRHYVFVFACLVGLTSLHTQATPPVPNLLPTGIFVIAAYGVLNYGYMTFTGQSLLPNTHFRYLVPALLCAGFAQNAWDNMWNNNKQQLITKRYVHCTHTSTTCGDKQQTA